MFTDKASPEFAVHIVSFGYKYGAFENADTVLDLRSMPNPFYVPELKELTGLDERVRAYIMQFDEAKAYEEKVRQLLNYTISLCKDGGQSQLTVAFGCTGGKHRSVTFASRFYDYFKSAGYDVTVNHRDIMK